MLDYYAKYSESNIKQGPQGLQKRSSLKSLKIQNPSIKTKDCLNRSTNYKDMAERSKRPLNE